MDSSLTIAGILADLIARRTLSDAQVVWIFTEMMTGRCGEAATAAFLVALRMKGESASEIAAAAGVLREHMIAWDPGRPDILDTCGTGGDGSGTFNISTATALVVAGAGVPVVKHGNRSVSSRSGSADVLAALGVRIDGDADFARLCLSEANFAFCFAPQFHPALKHISLVRRALGVPTVFNNLGPLANPAGAKYQLLGVGRPELLDLMAISLARLGTERAFIICGQDGLDEVTLSGSTQVREVSDGTIHAHEWTPADFGLESCAIAQLLAPHADASASMIKEVLADRECAARNYVLANAAAALLAARRVSHLRAGVDLARRSLASGKARDVLATLVRLSG